MSAVLGVFHRDGQPASDAVLAAMSALLAHRGAASGGMWVSQSVGLAHRASCTTAESAGERQPLVHRSAGLTLIADARIDNRAELLSALAINRGETVGDAELMLQAYARWGRECVRHLVGDFAFVVWDQRAQSMFCARDPMGVRPFYFFLSDRLFAFGSEIKALLRCPGVPNRIDDEQVALRFATHHRDRVSTLYAGISRLPAGETMVVNPAGWSQETYWRPERQPEARFSTDEQYVEAFREHFAAAVSARLRSSAPIGATLSGGLDSSSIVCMARHARGPEPDSPLHTFSLVFPGIPEKDLSLIDERSYIDSVLRGGGVIPHEVRGDLLGPLDDCRRILWHLDEPFFAPNLYLHWGMYAAAQDAGVRVLLDGFDGDSTVSHGFGRLNGLMRSGQWSAFESEVRAFALHRGRSAESVLDHFGYPYLAHLARTRNARAWVRASRQLNRRFDVSARSMAWRQGLLPLVPGRVRNVWRKVHGRSIAETHGLRAPYAAGVARRLERDERRDVPSDAFSEAAMHAAGLAQPLYQLTLETADKCARAFGIEPRYPFFDRRLIDFCLAVPDEQKFCDGWPRALFRRAMQGCLPPSIQWRSTKANLAPNFDRGMRAADLTALDGPSAAPYLHVAALRGIARSYMADSTNGWRNPDGQLLFRAAVLAEWLSGSWKTAAPAGSSAASNVRHRAALPPLASGLAGGPRSEPVQCRR